MQSEEVDDRSCVLRSQELICLLLLDCHILLLDLVSEVLPGVMLMRLHCVELRSDR